MNTLHNAFCPQIPTQGSIHLFLTQALLIGHSLLRTHSGLQPAYGSPEYSGKQEQMPLSQRAFDPQGEDAHGSVSIGSAIEIIYNNLISLRKKSYRSFKQFKIYI